MKSFSLPLLIGFRILWINSFVDANFAFFSVLLESKRASAFGAREHCMVEEKKYFRNFFISSISVCAFFRRINRFFSLLFQYTLLLWHEKKFQYYLEVFHSICFPPHDKCSLHRMQKQFLLCHSRLGNCIYIKWEAENSFVITTICKYFSMKFLSLLCTLILSTQQRSG